jgi:hypothetical protein
MYKFIASNRRWWNKPLVEWKECHLPAELVILKLKKSEWTNGVWLNSTKLNSGVVDLVEADESFAAQRVELPEYVKDSLSRIYQLAGVSKGCPDIVLWDSTSNAIHLVEVKRQKKR